MVGYFNMFIPFIQWKEQERRSAALYCFTKASTVGRFKYERERGNKQGNDKLIVLLLQPVNVCAIKRVVSDYHQTKQSGAAMVGQSVQRSCDVVSVACVGRRWRARV